MFDSVLDGSIGSVMLCLVIALVCGCILAFFYALKNKRFSKSMVMTLILLPAVVQAMIILINGSLGTGLSVLGAFSLVRFRSVQGNSKDITYIFLAMAVGIAVGVGQIYFALILTLILCVISLIIKVVPLGDEKGGSEIHLKVVLPDDISFKDEFAPVFEKYAKTYEVLTIKTSQLGSLFTVEYNVVLKEKNTEKELIDDLRIKNSNLPIVCNSMKYLNESQEKSL